MPSTRLTAQFVESCRPPEAGRIEYWDTHTRGLGLRVTDRGAKSWVVMYRTGGRQRRLTLGSFPKIKLAAAREMALEALNAVSRGHDPAEEKKQARNKVYVAPETVAKAAEAYIEQRVRPRNRSWKQTRRIFDKHVIPAWGRRPLEEITRRDVSALIDDIVANGTPYMANRVRAGLSAFFNWCIEKSKIEASPAMGVKPPCEESSRDRVLSDAEIANLWRAWDTMGYPFGHAFKMLLVTGQRRNEVCGMRWEDIDLDKALWTLPREMTKAGRLHEVPLSPLAMEILAQTPKIGSHVFTTLGDRPISGFSAAKRRCDQLSEVTGWRLHDLRRTVASNMARLGIQPHIIEKVLNHATGAVSGVAAVYNRHGYLDEKREALRLWASSQSANIQRPIKPSH